MQNPDDNNEKINNGKDINGMFPHADTVIDQCKKQGMSVDEIVDFCYSDVAIDKKRILNNFNIYIEKIKERENKCHIKIYDFILENFKKCKLFYDEGHPTNIILEKMSRDILSSLNIQEEDIHTNACLDLHENPVYPIVKQCLQMKWKDNEIRNSPEAKKLCTHMDFKEYVREYLWWRHEYME